MRAEAVREFASRCLLTLLALPAAQAQDAPAPARTRPKVGLVLSGGGARGAAHIGVIEALEEMHVPVDLVVGTSMGSIVGGLYAAGLSPAQIRDALVGADWSYLFTDATAREDVSFRRKQDDRSFLIDLGLGLRDGAITMPRGVLEGQKVEPLFRELTMPVLGRERFDDLRLPYRAVATELGTGAVVVLDHGELATAMRASLSIAGAFTPVEIDGRMLVDGGYAAILPVEVALALGVDVIIAVDISTPPARTEELTSIVDIQLNIMDVLMAPNLAASIEALRDGDIFLTPPVNDISFKDFGRAVEAADIGLACTRAAREKLSRLAVSDEEWQAYLARQRAPASEPPIVRSIRIENDSALDDGVLAALVHTRVGERLDPRALARDLERIYGLDVFETVDYHLTPEGDLTITAREKAWGPRYLRLGLALQDDFKGNATYGIGASVTWNPIDARGAEWRNEVEIGTRLRAFTEFYQPLDLAQRWFVAPAVQFQQRPQPIYADQDELGELAIDSLTFGLDFGRLLGTWGELRVGYRYERGDVEVLSGAPNVATGEYEQGGLFTSFSYDTFDSRYFPRHGVIGSTSLFVARDHLGQQADYERARAQLNLAESSGPYTLIFGVDVGTTLDEAVAVAVQNRFQLGGFGRLSGLKPDSLLGNELLLTRVIGWRSWGAEQRTPFSMPVYLGGSLELGNVWQSRDAVATNDMIPAGSLFVGVDTAVGPLFFGGGFAEDGRSTAFFYLGRLF